MNNQIIDTLLEEIFIQAATEIKTDRFMDTSSEASCSGQCAAGSCRTL